MRRLCALLARFVRAQNGNFAVMTALTLPLGLTAAAFAVDEAALYQQRRILQSAVDLAAIHAAGDPDAAFERARRALVDAGALDPDVPASALRRDNGGPLAVETGRYRPDPDLGPAERFAPDGPGPVNAVRVHMRESGQLFFAKTFFDSPTISAAAVAEMTPRAAFSIGSRLASVHGGIANAMLDQLLGISVSADLVDYRGLADVDVDLLEVFDALAGEIDLDVGTYDELLASDIAIADLALALESATRGAAPMAADILADLAPLIQSGLSVKGSQLVALDESIAKLALGTPGAGARAKVGVLELLAVGATLADGDHQIALELTAGLPGVAGVDVDLAVGEPAQGGAWYTVGPEGAIVRTAQVRARIVTSLLGHGGPLLGQIGLRVPVYAELAQAQAELTDVDCTPGSLEGASATIAARPGIVRVAIGYTDTPLDAFADPLRIDRATILNVLGLARIEARADLEAAQQTPQALEFRYADIAAGRVRTVETTTPVASLARGLVEDLDLDIELLGTPLLGALISGVLKSTVEAALIPLAPVIDSVLSTTLSTLGIGLGEADIRLHGIDCRTATLVQ